MNQEISLDLFKQADADFKEHISIENNSRIVFSGKFGHGKTTFLHEFFKDETQRKNFRGLKYRVIRLFPVNYSVASNEDIFRYIKYDIIIQMLKENYDVDEVFKGVTSLPAHLLTNIKPLIKAIVSMVPKVGKSISDIMEKADDILVVSEKYCQKVDKEIEANYEKGRVLTGFLRELEEKEGSLFEENNVTCLIEETLKYNKLDAVENVLLIDDLDRIDPEHIFRILNVFAAHFDVNNKGNKFGFDKVIIVCDIQNIRNVFAAKYGMDTDFNGYIDKFYTANIFNYKLSFNDLREFANKKLYTEAKIQKNRFSDYGYLNYVNQRISEYSVFFDDILLMLLQNKQIDLRNLVKWSNLEIPYSHIVNFSNVVCSVEDYPVIYYLQFFSTIKGDAASFKKAINQCTTDSLIRGNIMQHIQDLVYILTIMQHNNKANQTGNYTLDNINMQINIDEKGKSTLNAGGLTFNSRNFRYVICDCIEFLSIYNILQ